MYHALVSFFNLSHLHLICLTELVEVLYVTIKHIELG